MRRFPTTTFAIVLSVIALIVGWKIFYREETQRFHAVQQIRQQRSELHFGQAITHDKGPIAREEWRLDHGGRKSHAAYTAESRSGSRIAKFTEPIPGYDVTFAFEKLVQDGIWELQTRPLKGKTDNVYTITVAQVAGDRSGSHKSTFTDPKYLAVAGGRQYQIHLDKNKPVPNLLTLQSTSSA